MVSETKEIYEFGPFSLDVGQHRFNRSDGITSNSLPEKAFQTLVFLVRNQGRLVTKNELLDAVWPFTAVEENSLNKSKHAVRHALGEEPREQKYIETVHKHGYRFIATARRVDSVDSPTAAVNGAAAKKPDFSDQAYDLYARQGKGRERESGGHGSCDQSDSVEPRRKFIEDNALDVKNRDVKTANTAIVKPKDELKPLTLRFSIYGSAIFRGDHQSLFLGVRTRSQFGIAR